MRSQDATNRRQAARASANNSCYFGNPCDACRWEIEPSHGNVLDRPGPWISVISMVHHHFLVEWFSFDLLSRPRHAAPSPMTHL
ncbi:uncharacterized protein MYCGRDRAFT_106449, partial [Zymoseptoria tritici IPO323]